MLLNTLKTQIAFDHYSQKSTDAKDKADDGKVPRNHILNDLLRDELIINKLYEHVKTKMKSTALDSETFLLENNIQVNAESSTSID